MTTVLTAVLAYCCTFFATVAVIAYKGTVAADSAIVAPARFFAAFLADLSADLADYCTVSAMLAAILADLRASFTAIIFVADCCTVAADGTIVAPADRFPCAFFADLFAVLTDQSAIAAHLAAFLANAHAF